MFAKIGDRLLEKFVPRVSAGASCSYKVGCCVTMGARAVQGWRCSTDGTRAGGYGPCYPNGSDC